MKTLNNLVAEDNKDLRDTLRDTLERVGREVFVAGEAALAAWKAGRFDLLFTDISVPGMSKTGLACIHLANNPAQWVVR